MDKANFVVSRIQADSRRVIGARLGEAVDALHEPSVSSSVRGFSIQGNLLRIWPAFSSGRWLVFPTDIGKCCCGR
jgi:hypothetical protein